MAGEVCVCVQNQLVTLSSLSQLKLCIKMFVLNDLNCALLQLQLASETVINDLLVVG